MKMIKAENLTYEYTKLYEEEGKTREERFKALKDVNIEIERGSFVAVLGHNGSGKSTFAKHINALLTPSGGALWIKGFDTRNEELIWEIRQSAGMVFQNPDNQMVATVVEEDVAFGPENLGVPSKEIRKRVDDVLGTVRMSEYKTHSPNRLSGGQKQRIAIAGVLAMRPDCIVLDEPTAMLDPVGRKEVLETVMKLNREEGITTILITHYMDEAVKADKVFVIDDGNVVLEGTPREIFSQVETLKGYGLDVPQVTETAFQLLKQGIQMPKDILEVDELVSACEAVLGPPVAFSGVEIETPGNESKAEEEALEPCIVIKDLTHIYNEGTTFQKKALDNVNLTIYKGEFIGLIGHTGSGKSTLIQHLNALLVPAYGEILLNGKNIFADKTKLKGIRQKVGLVFQYPEHQLFEMTVYKDVSYGPANMNLSKEEVDARVRKALQTVGLAEDIYNKSPFDLSGGQKRRVAIAGVLAMEPEILILDEPTAGLDPRGRDEILDAIKQMHHQLGITVILVSHSMEDVARLVDRIIVMHRGKMALTGTPREVFQNVDRLEEMGLAAPQISYVLSKLSKMGYPVPTDIYTPGEAAKVLMQLIRQVRK